MIRFLVLLHLLLLSSHLTLTAQVFPAASWQTKTPADVGLDATMANQVAAAIGGSGVIIRYGYQVKTWGNPAQLGDWASACKPFYSTLLFAAVNEGRLNSVDDLVRPWVQQRWPGQDLITKDHPMTFRHLADMTSGYARGEAPGTHWAYNDYAITLYGELLLEVLNDADLDNAFQTRFPLGFEDGNVFGSRGGMGVEASPRDMARVAWLWMNKGNWNGTQLLPESYFDNYMKADVPGTLPRTTVNGSDYLGIGTLGGGSDQTATGPNVYGFNWWFNNTMGTSSTLLMPGWPSDAIQANGHWGQEVVLMIPSEQLIIAARGNWNGMGLTNALPIMQNMVRAAQPHQGQIVVDPNHPNRLIYHDTYININGQQVPKPCFFAGPGDPEDFFYYNTAANKSMLIAKGARCTYITAYLQDFGGGNPGTGSALSATLSQWEQHITDMENAGIITIFFIFDDSQSRPANWEAFVDSTVAKFKHHRLFIWSVAEEYSEALTQTQVSEVALRIRQQDSHEHVVGVHQLNGTSFDFNSDANLEMFLMQINATTATDIHNGVLAAYNNTSGQKVLNLAEIGDHAKQNRATARQWTWAGAMGGASAIQLLWMGRASDDPSWNEDAKYDDCAAMMDFFENTNVNEMIPRDDLIAGGTKWALADEGNSYIAYSDNISGNIGVMNMDAGDWKLIWLDIPTGTKDTSFATVSAGSNAFAKPVGFGNEIAVWINKCGAVSCSIITVNKSETICEGDSLFTGGDWQTQSGTYTDTFITSNGIDSICITNLTILLNVTVNKTAAICEGDSLFTGGAYQTQSGTYTDSYQSANGCDSTCITQLTVLPTIVVIKDVSICEGDSLFAGGNYQTQVGIYIDTFPSSFGCDSICETHLSVIQDIITTKDTVIREGDSLFVAGSYQTQIGIYIDTSIASNGCDSIHITNLMVESFTGVHESHIEAVQFVNMPSLFIVEIRVTGLITENLQLNVFDMQGKQVWEHSVREPDTAIRWNYGEIVRGIYLLRLTTDAGIFVGKVMVGK